jgi:predicted transcriptional regulator
LTFFKKTKSCATSAELTGDAGITNIMFYTYLTHSQASEYISQLMKSGLLGHRGFSLPLKQYYTTSNGIEYLATVERMADRLAGI